MEVKSERWKVGGSRDRRCKLTIDSVVAVFRIVGKAIKECTEESQSRCTREKGVLHLLADNLPLRHSEPFDPFKIPPIHFLDLS